MRIKKQLLREFARDLIALASIPFLVLTIVRVSVLDIYYPTQFIISSCLFFIFKAVCGGNLHAGLGIILLLFTSLYYNRLLFTIFALLVYIGIIFSLFYLGQNRKNILKGILFGGISAGSGYFISRLIFF